MPMKPSGLLGDVAALMTDADSDDGALYEMRGMNKPLLEYVADFERELTHPAKDHYTKIQPLDGRVEVLDFIMKAKAAAYLDRFSRMALCQFQSPIEELFFYGAVLAAWRRNAALLLRFDAYGDPLSLTFRQYSHEEYEITPQPEVGKFHPDFLVKGAFYVAMSEPTRFIRSTVAIECDGHDFHERTKEQAKRDKSRDRALMAGGTPVLRFTGSEIHASPAKCAESVFVTLMQTAWQREFEDKFRADPKTLTAYERDPIRSGLVLKDSGMDCAAWRKRLGLEGG